MSIRELLLFSAASAVLLAGCNSGSSTTAGDTGSAAVAAAVVSGDSSVVADKVSIIDTSSPTAKLVAALVEPIFPASADYNKDKSFTYINDRATSAFTNVNEILCMISQTGYVASAATSEAAAVPYKALVNKNLCKGNDSASNASQNQDSGASAPDYATWTVKSFLNASQQLEAHVWIYEKKSSDQSQGPDSFDKIITAKLIVSKTKDEAPPNGVFRIDFKAYRVTAGQPDLTQTVFSGLLESKINAATGLSEIRFADAEKNGMFSEAATVVKTSATTGYGKVSTTDTFNGGTPNTFTADFGFNDSFFRRSSTDGTTTKDLCFSRTSFETSTWRYGLYNESDGSRLTRNSGIPFNTAADGSGMYGWAGYYGIWAPDTSQITDGMSIYSKDPSTGSSLTYTLNLYKGKLKKHTQHTTTLGAIKNIPLEGNMPDPQNPQQMIMYRAIWNDITEKLMKTAEAPQSIGGPPVWADITPVEMSYSNLPFGTELNFWSQALGGQVRIPLQNCTFNQGVANCPDKPTNNSTVIFYTEDTINPNITVPTLACFDNCPKATNAVTGMDPNSMSYGQYNINSSSHTYSFTDMMLIDNATGFKAQLLSVPAGQTWGFNSGPLVDLTAIDTASGKTYSELLDCGIPNTPQTCGWKAWTLPVFYTWETGPNSWNQLAVVKNNGSAITFDPPLKVKYVHQQTDKYNGASFFLDYNGFGQLNGIPGKCFDPTTGVLDNCKENTRWVPEFSIPSGSTVTEGGNTYYVKALESEQRMKPAPTGCTATLPTTTLTLPSVSDAVDPAIGSLPSGDVKYIGGVKQGAKSTAKSLSRWLLGL